VKEMKSLEVIGNGERKYSRFRFTKWPLTILEESTELRKKDFEIPEEAKSRKYPVRALRYWWLHCAVQEEIRRIQGPLSIADIGCGPGLLKRFFPEIDGAYWIGLDINVDSERLKTAGYEELHCCDFNDPLPLQNSTADIVICSHVLEHVPRPRFTMGELSRILKPEGLMLIGVPVAPKVIAHVREWQFARQFEAGTRKKGHHMHSFWPKRICGMAENLELQIEFVSGTYLLRHKGLFLEDHRFWIRINQIWGALFPSLAQELCIQLRKHV
jgi:SAM-dependent methyltransferase